MTKNNILKKLVAALLIVFTTQLNAATRSVSPGESIQDAIDYVSANGGGTVTLAAGVHPISTSIKMKSNVTLSGAGSTATTINTSKVIKSIEQASEGLQNVTIQNLNITGVAVHGSHAIHLIAMNTDHTNIKLLNVHASNTGWGVHIKGAQDVTIRNCEFTQNGAKGKEGYAHNLYLRRCKNALVSHTKLIGSTTGNGCNISYSENITLDNCEVLNNYFRGIRAANTDGYTVTNCTIGGNGRVGLLANSESVATKNIRFDNNIVFNNGQGGIRAIRGVTGSVTNCISFGNQRFDFSLPTTVTQSGNSSEQPVATKQMPQNAEGEGMIRFFVSLEGKDTWSGRLERPSSNGMDGPFRSLEAARDAVRSLSLEERAKQPIEICILPGTYIRKAPLILEAQDSGTKKAPIVYRSWTDKPTVISGGKEVRQWTQTDLNGHRVLVADLSQLPGGYTPFEQLWVNGHRAIQARTPNAGYFRTPFDESQIKSMTQGLRGQMEALPYHADDEHHFDGIEDGVVVAFYKWLEFHLPFDRIDRENDNIIFAGKSMRRVETNERYYLEGGRAMLDQPGEWYLDRQANKLYYYPMADESEVVATLPSLISVIRIEGDAANDQFVEHVQFHGLTFSHTTWILPRDSGGAGLGQSDIRMDGAVRLQGARHCLFEECEITAIGNYGLEISLGCSNNRVLRCDIHDLGAGGILIGPKIRPRGNRRGNEQGDEIPPVLKHLSDATSNNEIADCRIYDGGRYFHCAVGVWVGQSPDNYVHHNEIYNFYYTGISTGWTWGYGPALATGNRYEYNHIHHLGRLENGDGPVLSDLGGIYFLGDQTGTVVRHNVFHDIWAGKYGGWALYTDQGTRNLLVENNLVYRCRHACFDQHFGKDNIIRNNIFAFADTSVVMLAKMESHTGFILTNNILLSDGTPIYAGGYEYDVNTPGAFKADNNLVWSTAGKVLGAQNRFPSRLYEPDEPVLTWKQWQALGYDQNTIIADPGFKDPANGDFRLSEGSPASQIGFKPFPLDKAGPR